MRAVGFRRLEPRTVAVIYGVDPAIAASIGFSRSAREPWKSEARRRTIARGCAGGRDDQRRCL